MKILQVSSSLSSESGGPSEAARLFSHEAAKQGVGVDTCCLDKTAPRGFLGKVYALGSKEQNYYFSPSLVPWLRQNHQEYNAIIVRGLWQYPGYAVNKALRGTNKPYYVFSHGMLDPWFRKHYPLKHIKKQLYWLYAQGRVLREASGVLFTSEEERVLARNSFWPYSCVEKVVSYGSDEPDKDLAILKEEFFQAYPALVSKRVILFLGRLHEKKGCDLLLAAFRTQLESGREDIHLVFAGPKNSKMASELQSEVDRQKLTEHVTFTGMLSGEIKWGAFAAAEVFVLPSHQENFGIAVAESLACSTPVLISNKVNIWREIKEHGAGIVAEVNQEAVSKQLSDWLSLSAEQKSEYELNARRCFDACFSITGATKSILEAVGVK